MKVAEGQIANERAINILEREKLGAVKKNLDGVNKNLNAYISAVDSNIKVNHTDMITKVQELDDRFTTKCDELKIEVENLEMMQTTTPREPDHALHA